MNLAKRILLLLFLIPALLALFLAIYNYDVEEPDTIIVLGAGITRDARSYDKVQSRVDNGLSLCNANTETIILTGGNYYKVLKWRISTKTKDSTEAKIMRAFWENENKNCNSTIILEERAVTTFSNAIYSIREMEKRGLKYAVVTSSEDHWHAYPFFWAAKILTFSKIKLEFYLR